MSTFDVNLNSVWSGMGLMESNLLSAQLETRARVEEMGDKLVGGEGVGGWVGQAGGGGGRGFVLWLGR